VIPEEGDAVRGVRAPKRLLQALHVVDVRRDDLGALLGEIHGLVGLRVARERPHGEPSTRVCENRAHQSAPLGAGGTRHGDDLLFHRNLP
jgi:hypothetical protein